MAEPLTISAEEFKKRYGLPLTLSQEEFKKRYGGVEQYGAPGAIKSVEELLRPLKPQAPVTATPLVTPAPTPIPTAKTPAQIAPEFDETLVGSAKRAASGIIQMFGQVPAGFESLGRLQQRAQQAYLKTIGAPKEFQEVAEKEIKERREMALEPARATKALAEKYIGAKPGPPKDFDAFLRNPLDVGLRLGIETIPMTALLAGATAINPVAGAAILYGVEAGETESTFDELEKQGAKVDPLYRDLAVVGKGALNAAFEGIGIRKILEKAPPGIKGKIFKILLSSSVEGITEGLQEINGVLAESGVTLDRNQAVTLKSVFDNALTDLGKNKSRIQEAALGGFIAGGATDVMVEGTQRMAENYQQKRREKQPIPPVQPSPGGPPPPRGGPGIPPFPSAAAAPPPVGLSMPPRGGPGVPPFPPVTAPGTIPPAVTPTQPPAPVTPAVSDLERIGDEISQEVYGRPFAQLNPQEQDLIVKTYEKQQAKVSAKKVEEAITKRLAPKPEKVAPARKELIPPVAPPEVPIPPPTAAEAALSVTVPLPTEERPPREPITPAEAPAVEPTREAPSKFTPEIIAAMQSPAEVDNALLARTLELEDAGLPLEGDETIAALDKRSTDLYAGQRRPAAGVPIPFETRASRVQDLPIAGIATDTERFQNRATDFSEKTAATIAERYDPNLFDPIVVWKDEKSGRTYVLSGHSRLEGMKRRGEKDIPARYFSGTEAEAIRYARLEANRLGTSENLGETLKAFRSAKQQNLSKKKLTDLFDGDVDFLDATINLNRNGDFVNILGQPASSEFPFIKRFARWVGELREQYPDKLTDRHEQQIFDWLYKEEKKNVDIGKGTFFNKISSQVDRVDFSPEQPLVLRVGAVPVVGTRARKDTAKLQAELDRLKRLRQETREAGEKETPKIDAEIERLQSGIADIIKAQPDLFAEPTPKAEPVKEKVPEKPVAVPEPIAEEEVTPEEAAPPAKPIPVSAVPIPAQTLESLDTWTGKAFRVDTGFKQDAGTTAAQVVRYEQDDLGNDLGVTADLLAMLEDVLATDVVWVTRTLQEGKRYGRPSEFEIPEGSKILAEDGDGGYLILKAKKKEAAPAEAEPEAPARPPQPAPTSKDLDDALLTFDRVLDRTKGRPTAEQQEAIRTELEAENIHPVIVTELTEPRRAKRPEEEDFPDEIGISDAYDLLREVETQQYATTRKGRIARAVEPPAELKKTADALASAGKAFADAKVSLQKAKEDIITEIEKRGGDVIVNTDTGAFTIKINAGKAKLRMADLLQLKELRKQAAEAGGYSLATVGRGLEIAIAPVEISPPTALRGEFADKAKEFIRRNNAAKQTSEAYKAAKEKARVELIDHYLAEKTAGRTPKALIGIAGDGTKAEIQVRRQRSAVEPDIGKYVEEIQRFKEEASARAERGRPFISTRETGKAKLAKARKAGAVVEAREAIAEAPPTPPAAPPKAAAPKVPPVAPSEKEFGAENVIVTREKVQSAFDRLRAKANKAANIDTLIKGEGGALDPNVLGDLLDIGTFYVEGGIREFKAWSEKMVADLTEKVNAAFADGIKPYLKNVFDEIKRRRPGLFKAPKAAPTAQAGLFGEPEAAPSVNILQAAAQKVKAEKAPEKPVTPIPPAKAQIKKPSPRVIKLDDERISLAIRTLNDEAFKGPVIKTEKGFSRLLGVSGDELRAVIDFVKPNFPDIDISIKPTPAAPVETKAEKEPWEMTKEEWFNYKWGKFPKKTQASIIAGDKGFVGVDDIRRQTDEEHRRNIEDAIREGKLVPANVLADYPDLAKKPEAEKPPVEKPKPSLIQQAAITATEQAALSADIVKTKFGGTLPDGRKLVGKNIASRGGAQGVVKDNPNREVVAYKETNGAERFAVIERVAAPAEKPSLYEPFDVVYVKDTIRADDGRVLREKGERLIVISDDGKRLIVDDEDGFREPIDRNLVSLEQPAAPAVTPEPIAPEAEKLPNNFRNLANLIKIRLERGAKMDNPALTAMAEEAFGGTRAEGAYTPKDAYDALELAVNEFIAESPALMTIDAKDTLRTLRDLMRILPRQTDRTEEQQQFQQFSTPPTQAFVAAKMLNPQEGETVLEPSAGTGGLAVFAKLAGANVHANEISPRRAQLLRMQGYPVTEVDAGIINDVLPDNIKPTAILMNPPFSATGGRVARNRTEYGAKHVESALVRLENGGRLVAIVGQGMAMDRPTFTEWWKKIAKRYNVRANIGIPGDEFGKYGTTFDNNIIVIDKTGPTPGNNWAEQTNNIVKGDVANLEEALNVTAKIAADRQAVEVPARIEAGAGPMGEREGVIRPGVGAAVRKAPGGGRLVEPGGRPAGPAGVTEQVRPEEGAGIVRPGEPGLEPAPTPAQPGEPAERPPISSRIGRPEDVSARPGQPAVAPGVTLPEEPSGLEAKETGVARETEASGKFVKYKPAKLKGGVPHPANIVESSSMAAVDPPDITYKASLPTDVIKEGKLSDLQLETVHYAGQQFEKIMPNGQRMAYFIGDGTGVGKGRQITGIISDQWNKGVKRILWISASGDLIEDAKRDLNDLGLDVPINRINDYAPGDDIVAPNGIIFSTYTSLIAKSKTGKKQSRQQQLENWLGNDSIIIFDEAHKAKNALAVGSMGKPTQTAQATIDIQNNLPLARVVYSSATGATDVRNMAYMTRLGLWGPKTSFPEGFIQFLSEIDGGGVGAMEMVARDMKALGMYSSRAISFEGVDYRERIHELTADQRRIYNIAAGAWQVVLKNIEEAIGVTNGGAMQRAKAMSAFWGTHQRFFKQIITAMKVPTAIKEVEKALDDGRSVVLSIIGTGESRTKNLYNKAIAEGQQLEELDFTPRETIANLVNNSFPTQLYQDETDPDTGNTIKVPVVDKEGNPVQSKEALEMKEALLEKLSDLSLPENPLDQVVNYFGPDRVAEMTGRKRRLIRNPKTGKVEYVKRAPDDVAMSKINIHENKQFQDGKKRIAIISDAAATGISLHASNRAVNKDRRTQITLELGWSADKQMQTFGRTHRTDQASAPEYVLLSTDVGGEKRFSSTIARRLASLGALTKGQRDATGGGELAKYNFETKEGEAAVSSLYLDMMNSPRIGILENPRQALRDMGILKVKSDGTEDIDKDDWTHVPRFLNRVLALDIERQNVVFDEFIRQFEDVVKSSKESGTFDDGVADIKGESIRLPEKPEVIHVDPNTKAATLHYTVEVDVKTDPFDFDDAHAIAKEKKAKFFKQKRSGNFVLVSPSGSRTDQKTGKVFNRVRIWTPARRSSFMDESDFIDKYEAVPSAEVKDWWIDKVKQIPPIETQENHIIGGAILPLWQKLKTADAQRLKVVRVVTDDKKRIVGILIPEENVGTVLRSIGVSRTLREASDIFNAVLNQNEVVNLVGGLQLKKSRVHGDDTIELTGADYYKFKELRGMGLIDERIDWKQRFFVPTDEKKGVAALEKLLEMYPAIEAAAEEEPPSVFREQTEPYIVGDVKPEDWAPIYYSQLERTLERKLPNSGTAEQFVQMIDGFQRKGEFKADELDWLGLKDWLGEQKGKISKQDVLEFVRENQVRIEEITKAGSAVDEGAEFSFDTKDFRRNPEDYGFNEDTKEMAHTIVDLSLQRQGYYDLIGKNVEPDDASGDFEILFNGTEKIGKADFIEDAIELAKKHNQKRFGGIPKYEQYQLPGGERYSELLFTMPSRLKMSQKAKIISDKYDLAYLEASQVKLEALGATKEEIKQWKEGIAEGAPDYRKYREQRFISTHFDEPNILAHVRFNERTDADGKRVLFVEEIQSDWHQLGRQKGYKASDRILLTISDIELENENEFNWFFKTPQGTKKVSKADYEYLGINAVNKAKKDVAEIFNTKTREESEKVPQAPFKTTWQELVMKRMLRWAAENNFERLAWTTGEQQAERYDLSKQVDEIAIDKAGENSYNLTVAKNGNSILNEEAIPSQRVADLIGKEMAERAIVRADEAKGKVVNLTGLDLKVGGEGMKGFYDKILPQFMNKYGKKWGARVGENFVTREVDEKYEVQGMPGGKFGVFKLEQMITDGGRSIKSTLVKNFDKRSDAVEFWENYRTTKPEKNEVHSIDITPAMRKAVLMEGQALFEQTEPYEPNYEKRPDASAKTDRMGKEAVESIGNNRRRGRVLLANAISAEAREKSTVSLIGKQVRTSDDVAALAQVYRDPRWETLRYIFVKNGKVVFVTGVSSRLPASTPSFPVGEKSAIDYLKGLMFATEADGYYLLHNHPSGVATASPGDLDVTESIADNVDGFKGHVIIDSGEYAVLTRKKGEIVEDRKKKDFGLEKLLVPSILSPVLGKPIFGETAPETVAKIGQTYKAPEGWVTLISHSAAGVRGMMEVESAVMQNTKKALAIVRRFARQTGGANVYLVSDQRFWDKYKNDLARAIRNGFLTDAVSTRGYSVADETGAKSEKKRFGITEAVGREVREPSAKKTKIKWETDLPPNRDYFAFAEQGGLLTKQQDVNIDQIESVEKVDEKQVNRLIEQFKADPSAIPPIVTSIEPGENVDILPIMDGHHRLEAARRLGITKIPVHIYFSPDEISDYGKDYSIKIGTTREIEKQKDDLRKKEKNLVKVQFINDEGSKVVQYFNSRQDADQWVSGINRTSPGFINNLKITEPSARLPRRGENPQIYTETFKKWFGDWENDPANASKVVDKEGKPLVVYHGSEQDFDVFGNKVFKVDERGKPLRNSFGFGIPEFIPGKGIYYFSFDEDYYKNIAGQKKKFTRPFYLNLRNPAKLSLAEMDRLMIDDEKADELKRQGYDGAIDKKSESEIVVFDSTQIKSAIGNVGTFSTTEPSIIREETEPYTPTPERDLVNAVADAVKRARQAEGDRTAKQTEQGQKKETSLTPDDLAAIGQRINEIIAGKKDLKGLTPEEKKGLDNLLAALETAGRTLGKTTEERQKLSFSDRIAFNNALKQLKTKEARATIAKIRQAIKEEKGVDATFLDKLAEWTASMYIWRLSSAGKSLSSNIARNLIKYPELKMAAWFNKGVAQKNKVPIQIRPQEAMEDFRATWMSGQFKEAWKTAMQFMREEIPIDQSEFFKREHIKPRAIKGKKGRWIRAGLNAQGAIDVLFRLPAIQGEIARLTFRKAMQQTNDRVAALKLAEEYRTKVKQVESLQKAGKEIPEELAEFENIVNEAKKNAMVLTFQEELGGIAQALSQTRRHALVRLFVPFMNTQMNILKQTFARTPFVLAHPEFLSLSKKAIQKRLTQEEAGRLSERLAQMTVGTLAFTTMLLLLHWMGDDDEITGDWDLNKLAEKPLGWQQNSVRIGNRYISYQGLEPFASMFRAWGNIRESKQTGLAAAIDGLAQVTLNNPLTSEIFDIIDTAKQGKADEFFVKMIAGMALPGIVSDVSKIIDPTIRRKETLLEKGIAQTGVPGYTATLPPLVDVFGQELVPQTRGERAFKTITGLGVSAVKDDPARAEIHRIGLKMRVGPFTYKKVILTSDESMRLNQLIGERFHQQVTALLKNPTYKAMSSDEKKKTIRSVRGKLLDYYKKAIERTPAFRERMMTKKKEERSKASFEVAE